MACRRQQRYPAGERGHRQSLTGAGNPAGTPVSTTLLIGSARHRRARADRRGAISASILNATDRLRRAAPVSAAWIGADLLSGQLGHEGRRRPLGRDRPRRSAVRLHEERRIAARTISPLERLLGVAVLG